MALFFDYKLQSPLLDPNYLFFEWHNTFPIMAIASYSRNSTGQVHVHFEEGEHDDSVVIQRAAPPTRVLWHPKKKIFLVTWENGEITTWNDNTKRLESFSGVHQAPVCAMAWSSNGTRLITGDLQGLVVVWKTDANGKLVQPPINQFSMNETVTEIICKPSSVSVKEKELRDLARAAIAGDEAALELFEYRSQSGRQQGKKQEKQKIDTKNIFMGSSEALSFIVAGDKGSVYYVTEAAKFLKLFQMESGIARLAYNQDKSILVAVTQHMMLGQYVFKSDTDIRNVMTVKLSSGKGGGGDDFDCIWIGSNLLAYVSGENMIRVMDVDKDATFTLPLLPQQGYMASGEVILTLSYSAAKGIIAAGTNRGNVAMWKYMKNKERPDEPESSWQLAHAKVLQKDVPIKKLKFGTNLHLICANLITDAYILSEQKMSSDFRDGLAAVQLGPTIIHLAFFKQHLIKEEKVDVQFKGLTTAKNHIVIWSGKQVKVFEMTVNPSTAKLDDQIGREERGNFACATFGCAIYEQNVYTLEPSKVNVRTFQGTVKQTLQFTENEGDPFICVVNGSFMAIGTTQGIVKVYDLGRREAKNIGGSLNLKQQLIQFNTIKEIGISCDGMKVTVTALKTNSEPDPKLYLWNLEKDQLCYFDFERGLNDVDEVTASSQDDTRTTFERSKQEIGREICGRYPSTHHWEHLDSRLLVCEIYLLPTSAQEQQQKHNKQHNKSSQKNAQAPVKPNNMYGVAAARRNEMTSNSLERTAECLVVSLFFNADLGLLVYDSYARGEIYSKLISVKIPYHFFVTKGRMIESADQRLEYVGYQVPKAAEGGDGSSPMAAVKESEDTRDFLFYSEFLAAKVMRDFIGMSKADNNTTEALLNFSYYLTIGDMDEAFKAIKLIKKESVWENMAQMCVKSHRVDVAKVCLSNMGNIIGIRMLREETQKGADSDTQVAIVALCLGMIEEAEKLLLSSKRYDLLNKLYQNMDLWPKALEIAQKFDRIHLRNTCFNYAKFCEERNEVNLAVDYYEKSDTHRTEVPRMFLERDELANLQRYTEKTKDKELYRWWGHYFESMNNLEMALTCYKEAADYLSLCRVYCATQNVKAAIELCEQTNDSPASYHLARHFERHKKFKDAISYYQRAGAISNAIRLCKENDLNESLATLAFQGSPQDMLDAARHYETVPGEEDKAVILYHKAGHTSKAVDLAFRANKYAALGLITDGINERTDPALVRRMADFFMENDQFDKAVDLMAVSKKVDQALELMLKHNVPITEQLVEKLTPPKPTNEHDMTSYYNTLELIGDAAFDQRLYTLAAKKYTEANNRIKAMKALMKSGDTSRVIFFANIQKQRETYIMAANYLQTLDWRKDPEIMKSIVQFYTKAKSMESLAGFYEACAQVEIDEFQDYDKAMSALAEAYKCLTKSANVDDTIKAEEMVAQLKLKLTLIKKFIDAKSKLMQGHEEGLKDLQQLLQVHNLEQAVRMGDIYSMIIEYQANHKRWKQAYGTLQEMRSSVPEGSIRYFVNPQLLQEIHHELGIEYKAPAKTEDVFGGKKKPADRGDNDEPEDNIKDVIGYGSYED